MKHIFELQKLWLFIGFAVLAPAYLHIALVEYGEGSSFAPWLFMCSSIAFIFLGLTAYRYAEEP